MAIVTLIETIVEICPMMTFEKKENPERETRRT
jgi:hypothetical protein